MPRAVFPFRLPVQLLFEREPPSPPLNRFQENTSQTSRSAYQVSTEISSGKRKGIVRYLWVICIDQFTISIPGSDGPGYVSLSGSKVGSLGVFVLWYIRPI